MEQRERSCVGAPGGQPITGIDEQDGAASVIQHPSDLSLPGSPRASEAGMERHSALPGHVAHDSIDGLVRDRHSGGVEPCGRRPLRWLSESHDAETLMAGKWANKLGCLPGDDLARSYCG